MISVKYLLFHMKLLNRLFCNMFGSVLECYGLTGVSLLWTRRALANTHPSRQPNTSARKTWYPDSAPILWNAKAEKIQDLENHTKTIVLNQENNISYPRFLYITARNSIHVQDVVNTCVKMKIYMREWKLMYRKYQYPKHKDHTKMQLIASRYKITPNQTKSH